MPRRITGRHPDTKKGWKHICDLIDDRLTWHVYERRQDDWLNIKLVAKHRAVHKGNYWLSWRGSVPYPRADTVILAEGRPALNTMVNALVAERLGLDLI